VETIPFTIASKKSIPTCKVNKGELQTPEERNRGRLKKVDRSPVLMDW
jgi:hypothetical protein